VKKESKGKRGCFLEWREEGGGVRDWKLGSLEIWIKPGSERTSQPFRGETKREVGEWGNGKMRFIEIFTKAINPGPRVAEALAEAQGV
jgi:hypothetical protein